jgi:hypothetical protein
MLSRQRCSVPAPFLTATMMLTCLVAGAVPAFACMLGVCARAAPGAREIAQPALYP